MLMTACEPVANSPEFRLFLGMDPYVELTAELAALTSQVVDASGNFVVKAGRSSSPSVNAAIGLNDADASPYAKGKFWKGSSLDDFEFLDESEIQRNLYLDCSFSHNFKVRGPTYRADKRKVKCID